MAHLLNLNNIILNVLKHITNSLGIWYRWSTEESNMYRINQDGKKLFDIMLEQKKILKTQLLHKQMLIFSYNEKNIEKCIEMESKQNDIPIMIGQSSRWFLVMKMFINLKTRSI